MWCWKIGIRSFKLNTILGNCRYTVYESTLAYIFEFDDFDS